MGMMINRRRVYGGEKKTDDFDVVSVIPKIIPNTYIHENSGSEVPWNGWSSTDFIPVTGFSAYYVETTSITYSAFYDASKNKIDKPSSYGEIPSNAKYVRFSNGGRDAYSTFILIKNKIVANVYESSKYIDQDGTIKDYGSWSVYKFALPHEAYVLTSTNNRNQASYNSDNSVFDSGKYFLHKPTDGYVLASCVTVSSITFYYGLNYGIIDYSSQ